MMRPADPERWGPHSICGPCWDERNPGREPHRIIAEAAEELCCYCGRFHRSGIYLRMPGSQVPCKGQCMTREAH